METIIPIIILVISVSALIAGIVYALFIKNGLPNLKFKKQGSYIDFEATTWAETEFLSSLVDPDLVALSAFCLMEAWKAKNPNHLKTEEVENVLKNVGYVITMPETFPKWGYYDARIVNAVQVWAKGTAFSRQIPICITHQISVSERISTYGNFNYAGEPVIHEMTHALLHTLNKDADHIHSKTEFWFDIAEEAQKLYLEMVKK